MSNILIIKHGSLGDLIQANGAIQDIKNSFKNSKGITFNFKSLFRIYVRVPIYRWCILDKRRYQDGIYFIYLDLKKLLKNINFHMFLIYKIQKEQNFIKNIY